MAGAELDVIQICAYSPEQDAMHKMMKKWCDDNGVSPNAIFSAVLPKIIFCLRNYTRVDKDGRLIITLNLAETPVETHESKRRKRKARRINRKWDSAL